MIPKKVKVAGFIVPVRMVNKIEGGYLGSSYYQGNKIVLAKRDGYNCKISSQPMHETLCHEIVHQISVRYNVGLSEREVKKLSTGLYQVLKDNKLKF